MAQESVSPSQLFRNAIESLEQFNRDLKNLLSSGDTIAIIQSLRDENAEFLSKGEQLVNLFLASGWLKTEDRELFEILGNLQRTIRSIKEDKVSWPGIIRDTHHRKSFFTNITGLFTRFIVQLRKTHPPESVNKDECPICLEPMVVNFGPLPCHEKHTFHNACISPWLQVNSTCPLCKDEVERPLFSIVPKDADLFSYVLDITEGIDIQCARIILRMNPETEFEKQYVIQTYFDRETGQLVESRRDMSGVEFKMYSHFTPVIHENRVYITSAIRPEILTGGVYDDVNLRTSMRELAKAAERNRLLLEIADYRAQLKYSSLYAKKSPKSKLSHDAPVADKNVDASTPLGGVSKSKSRKKRERRLKKAAAESNDVSLSVSFTFDENAGLMALTVPNLPVGWQLSNKTAARLEDWKPAQRQTVDPLPVLLDPGFGNGKATALNIAQRPTSLRSTPSTILNPNLIPRVSPTPEAAEAMDHIDDLLDGHSNVKAAFYGPRLSQGMWCTTGAILVVVERKGVIPASEEPFPPHWLGVPVDIVEGDCGLYWPGENEFIPPHQQSVERLAGGSSISVDSPGAAVSTGTMGHVFAFQGKLYALSSGHILQQGMPVCHPSISDYAHYNGFYAKRSVGTASISIPHRDVHWNGRDTTVDVALIEVSDVAVSAALLVDNTKIAQSDMDNVAPEGTQVYKFGRTTGATSATLSSFALAQNRFYVDWFHPGSSAAFDRVTGPSADIVDKRNDNVTVIRNQLLVDSKEIMFAYHGDSGAVAFRVDQNGAASLVGIVTGGFLLKREVSIPGESQPIVIQHHLTFLVPIGAAMKALVDELQAMSTSSTEPMQL